MVEPGLSVPDDRGSPPTTARPVHPLIDRLAAYSWRLIVIGVVGVAALWLLSQLRIVVVPIAVALLMTRVLAGVSQWLERRRWRPGLAAATTLLGFLALLGALLAGVVALFAREASSLGATLTQAIDDVEDWIVEDSGFDVSRAAIDRLREQTADRAARLVRSSDGAVVEGATLVAEIAAGTVLAIVLTFFMLRDGARFTRWVIGRALPQRRTRLTRAAARAWDALGGFLRGAALLGAVESVAIGIALFAVGGGLVAPVMVVTFLAAFVPIVGAVVAGVIAVLVALVTGGVIPAVIVAVVALVVQQLDNDLLAPLIYGRALNLHPVVVLLSVVAGGALFGLAGTMLAVPIVAVAVNVVDEWRGSGDRDSEERRSAVAAADAPQRD